MTIRSLDQYIAAPKQRVPMTKTATATITATSFSSLFDLAGAPGAGVLAGTSTTAGVVPVAGQPGFPSLNAFGVGAQGALGNVSFGSSVAGRIRIYDLLFKAGAYAFNATQVLTGQPSFASRVPGGTDFKGLELWVEAVTAFTGNLSIAITYIDQDGNAGATTGTYATGIAPIARRMILMPMTSGDSGLQKVESVTATVATAGTFNILVMRQLYEMNVRLPNGGDTHDMLKTGLVQVFPDSALYMVVAPDSTSTGTPSVTLEIVNG